LEDNAGQSLYEFLARIAHRYYVDDRTQEEIARRVRPVAGEGSAPARPGA